MSFVIVFVSATSGSAGMTSRASSRAPRESKPSFIIKPRRCFADEGGKGKFRASFDGEPTPTIEWLRKGVKVEASDKFRVSVSGPKQNDILVCTEL